ncbi:hypothetical protein MO973_19845 [Paenibacillus sp. TRM 82003]|nr:hypothetical protein [Paenibacillus sp. TRM 82003]
MAIEIKGKQYEVRELTFADSMALSLILDKTGFDLKDFNKEIKGKRLTKEQTKAIGFEFAMEVFGYIIRNYHKAHKETRNFLASLINVTPEEFEKMPLATPVLIVKELAKTVDLKDFFTPVAD